MKKAGTVKVPAPKPTSTLVSSKHLPGAGDDVAESALIGGIGNRKGAKNEGKRK